MVGVVSVVCMVFLHSVLVVRQGLAMSSHMPQRTTRLMLMAPAPIDPGPDLVCRMAARSFAQVHDNESIFVTLYIRQLLWIFLRTNPLSYVFPRSVLVPPQSLSFQGTTSLCLRRTQEGFINKRSSIHKRQVT